MAINNNQNNYSGSTSKTSDPASSQNFGSSNFDQSTSGQSTQGQTTASSYGTSTSSNYAHGASAANRGVNTSSQNQNFSAKGIEDTVGQIVDQVFHALQPRIHDYVSHFAGRMLGSADINPQQIVRRVRQRPALTIGALVVLAIGVGFLFTRDTSSQLSPHELH